jgi:Methyltransferase domain
MSLSYKILRFFRRIVGTQPLIDQVNAFNQLYHDSYEFYQNERYSHDILTVLYQSGLFPSQKHQFRVTTDFPVAFESSDHLFPWGAVFDNTRCISFVIACERLFPEKTLDYFDLGCSGGGLILDFLLRGHHAVGIEGSDVSLRSGRAEWKLLSNTHLFTADATKPFQIEICADLLKNQDDFEPFSADVISAWEFMEHIREEDLPEVFQNVKNHLKINGYFIGSICLVEGVQNGVTYHQTVKPYEWWQEKFAVFGFEFQEHHPFGHRDFARGSGNKMVEHGEEYDIQLNPEMGFHFVAKLTNR